MPDVQGALEQEHDTQTYSGWERKSAKHLLRNASHTVNVTMVLA